jgi:hypothetical protein
VRRDLPRWVRHLREMGVAVIPTSPLAADAHRVAIGGGATRGGLDPFDFKYQVCCLIAKSLSWLL